MQDAQRLLPLIPMCLKDLPGNVSFVDRHGQMIQRFVQRPAGHPAEPRIVLLMVPAIAFGNIGARPTAGTNDLIGKAELFLQWKSLCQSRNCFPEGPCLLPSLQFHKQAGPTFTLTSTHPIVHLARPPYQPRTTPYVLSFTPSPNPSACPARMPRRRRCSRWW